MSDHKTTTQAPSNFIRGVIERDLANKSFEGKTWAGSPGDASHHSTAAIDQAKIRILKKKIKNMSIALKVMCHG